MLFRTGHCQSSVLSGTRCHSAGRASRALSYVRVLTDLSSLQGGGHISTSEPNRKRQHALPTVAGGLPVFSKGTWLNLIGVTKSHSGVWLVCGCHQQFAEVHSGTVLQHHYGIKKCNTELSV